MDEGVRLFHVSETAGITRFEPRPAKDGTPLVWAIGEERLHNYLLPRECPRVTYYAGPKTTAEDKARFLGSSRHVVAIESDWYERCLDTVLSIYEFDPAPFQLIDVTAAYYTCEEAVVPVGERRVSNVVHALLERSVEVRFLPSLWHLREAVVDSTLQFSIIRMRNAAPPPSGFVTAYPVASA